MGFHFCCATRGAGVVVLAGGVLAFCTASQARGGFQDFCWLSCCAMHACRAVLQHAVLVADMYGSYPERWRKVHLEHSACVGGFVLWVLAVVVSCSKISKYVV